MSEAELAARLRVVADRFDSRAVVAIAAAVAVGRVGQAGRDLIAALAIADAQREPVITPAATPLP